MASMTFEVRIHKDGRIINSVTGRDGVDCAAIKQITMRLGVEESDEALPDCAAEVHQTVDT